MLAKTRLLLCLALLAVAEGGCVPSSEGVVSAGDLSGAADEVVNVDTVKNGTVTLGPFATVGGSCQVTKQARTSLVMRPHFGKVRAALRSGDLVLDPQSKLGARCNGAKIVGATMIYTTKPDFVGEDSFRFRLRFVNGEVRHITVKVTVKPS